MLTKPCLKTLPIQNICMPNTQIWTVNICAKRKHPWATNNLPQENTAINIEA